MRKGQTRARTPNSVDLFVARRLRLIRCSHGMSQATLGRHIGVTFQQIQKYERAETRISAGTLWDIAYVLGVSVLSFYEGLFNGEPFVMDRDLVRLALMPQAERRNLIKTALSLRKRNG